MPADDLSNATEADEAAWISDCFAHHQTNRQDSGKCNFLIVAAHKTRQAYLGISETDFFFSDGRYGPSKDYLKSELNYVRFELPSLLPNVSKVIYLDPDVVVQADVEELWKTALPHGSKYVTN